MRFVKSVTTRNKTYAKECVSVRVCVCVRERERVRDSYEQNADD